jgi:hypothetical protein
MEPEGSLLFSQEPVMESYRDPDESSPLSHKYLSLRSILILSSHLHVASQVISFLQIFQVRFIIYFSHLLLVLYGTPISSYIW